MVTKCSALELGPKEIRVNSVNAGAVQTPIGRALGLTAEQSMHMYDGLIPKTLMGRIGNAQNIADHIVFLLSEDAVNITGSIQVNDSGLLLKPVSF